MQIATALWGFRELSMVEVLEACEKLGIKRIEGHLHPDVPKHFRLDMKKEELNNILELAHRKGIRFICLATCNDFTVEKRKLEKEIKWVKDVINFAEKIGVKLVRVFAGFIKREYFDEEKLIQLKEAFEEVASFAFPKGISLAIENHGGITTTVEDLERIFSVIDSLNVGLNYDPANFFYYGEDPIKALEAFKDKIIYAHLKDVKIINGKKEYCAIGDGVIDWKILLPALERYYEGPVAIEYERASDVVEGTKKSLIALSKWIKVE